MGRAVILKCCTKNVFDSLRSASHQAAKASCARESLPQCSFVALPPANVGQLLKDMPFFLVRQTLLELSLFVTKTLAPGGETWRRHVQQDVGTRHPVARGEHGVQSMDGDIVKTEMLLDTFRKKFHGPAQPVSHDHLACRGPQIIAGTRRAATIRSVAPFGTHQLDLAHGAQRARGVSDANVHALACVPMRRQTHGVPLAPAMTVDKRINVAPLPRGESGQSERVRCDAAGCPQGHNAVPAVVGDGLCDLCVVRAALGQHQDLTPIRGATRVLQGERAQGGHHALMFAVIREIMRLALPLALKGDRSQRHQHVTQHEDDIGPRMTADLSCAVLERFGVFRVQTGPVLPRPVDDEHDCPGQPVEPLERLGTLPGWCLRETFQRGDGHLGMGLHHVRAERWMQSGTSGGFCEGLVRGDDHQEEPRAGAHPLKPLTDGNRACDPRLPGPSEHRASPRCAPSPMGGSEDATGKRLGCPGTLGKDVICGLPETASL